MHFYPKLYYYLFYIMHKNTFCSHFWHFGWHFIKLLRFSTAYSKSDRNVGPLSKHMHGDDSSMHWHQVSIMSCSRLIQTSLVTSWIHKHSWKSSNRYIAARQLNFVIDWLLGVTNLERQNLSTFFHPFQRVFCLVCFPQVVQKQTLVRWELKQSVNR